jgi:putative transferase (TIGR04331 family)
MITPDFRLQPIDQAAEWEEAWLLYDLVTERMAEWLSECFGERTVRQWEFILYRWLLHYVEHYYACWLYAERALLGQGAIRPVLLDGRDFQTPTTKIDLSNRYFRSDLFHLEVFSLIFSELTPASVVLRRSDFSVSPEFEPREMTGARRLIRRLRQQTRNVLYNLTEYAPADFDHASVVVHNLAMTAADREAIGPLQCRLHDARSVMPRLSASLRKPDWGLRSRLDTRPGDSALVRGILAALRHHTPTEFVEGFSRIERTAASRCATRGVPAAILSASMPRTEDRVWVTEVMRRGARLILAQHGGSYGECVANLTERIERRVSHEFLTWGWHEGPETRPMPSFRLAPFAGPPPQGSSLLFLSPRYSPIPQLENMTTADPEQVNEEFMAALAPAIRSKTILRISVNKYSREEEQAAWRARYPELILDRMEVPIRRRLADARFVVIGNHFSTTFLECLVMNKPVIAVGALDWNLVRPGVRAAYDMMIDAGIFHTSPTSASLVVNAAFDDPFTWWNDPTRKAAAASFARRFANTEDLHQIWRRYLEALPG